MAGISWWVWLGLGLFVSISSLYTGGNLQWFAWAGLIFIVIGIAIFAGASPYRVKRITAFQNFDVSNLNTTSYHTKQIVIALGSGGFSGVGFGNSIQKYSYLPEHTTDSIFAIFAEEAGFIGSMGLIALLCFFFWRALSISKKAPDIFGRLLGTGLTVCIMVQAFVNIAAISGLLPLTGVALPFISYGSTSLVVTMGMAGIILNISKYT